MFGFCSFADLPFAGLSLGGGGSGVIVYPTGLVVIISLGAVLVWVPVQDTQTAGWAAVDTTQVASWVQISDTQSPSWQNVLT